MIDYGTALIWAAPVAAAGGDRCRMSLLQMKAAFMQHEISRRQFNRATAALPLIGFPLAGSDVSNQRLLVQCHRIYVEGHHFGSEDWRLGFFVRVVQRKQSDSRYWYGRLMLPTDEFIQRLRDQGIQVERHSNTKRLVAERVTLRGSVAAVCCMLEAAFPTAQQHEFYTDPTPERWGDYTVPCNSVVKRFWVGTDRGSSS